MVTGNRWWLLMVVVLSFWWFSNKNPCLQVPTIVWFNNEKILKSVCRYYAVWCWRWKNIDEFASLNRFLFYKSVVILFGDYFEKEIYLGYRALLLWSRSYVTISQDLFKFSAARLGSPCSKFEKSYIIRWLQLGLTDIASIIFRIHTDSDK